MCAENVYCIICYVCKLSSAVQNLSSLRLITYRDCLFLCRKCLLHDLLRLQIVFLRAEFVFITISNVQRLSCSVHRSSFRVHKSSSLRSITCRDRLFLCRKCLFGVVYHLPVAHGSTWYNVLYQSYTGVVHFAVALHTTRFSVHFATRRVALFIGATFGRAAHGDQRAMHLSLPCQAPSSKVQMGACGLEMAKPSPKVEIRCVRIRNKVRRHD